MSFYKHGPKLRECLSANNLLLQTTADKYFIDQQPSTSISSSNIAEGNPSTKFYTMEQRLPSLFCCLIYIKSKRNKNNASKHGA